MYVLKKIKISAFSVKLMEKMNKMKLLQSRQALRQSSRILHLLSVPNTPGYEHEAMLVLVSHMYRFCSDLWQKAKKP